MITALALSTALDVTYIADDLRLGGISVPTAVYRSAGGKSLNVARAAHRLGSRVRTIAVLGGHVGALVRSLVPEGIESRVIDGIAQTRTCITIASQGELTELYETAPRLTVWPLVQSAVEAVSDGWLVVSGSVPAGAEGLPGLLADRKRSGLRIAVDSHGPLLEQLLDVRPNLVKINRAEATALLGDASAEELAARLHERTGEIAVVTDGVHGSFAASVEGRFRVRPNQAVGQFPVGSGDCYLGGLLDGLDRGWTLPESLRAAAAVASANAAQPGAASFDLADVAAALSRIEVE